MLINDIIKPNSMNDKFNRPYIIAEAGVNHEGSMNLARRLIDESADSGADAIKFQTYKADTIASKNSPSYWDLKSEPTTNQHSLFKKYDKFWKKEFEDLANYCINRNIQFLSTPFDFESAEFLNDLMPLFKISSSDITNLPFIEFQCSFNKPIILSTGASKLWEIHEAVEVIDNNNNPLCLMHCILNYPTDDNDANLGMILDLKENFPSKTIGYSDHTLPKEMDTLLYSWLLGAEVIEKHFTFDKKLPGNDHYHAMDKSDLKIFIEKIGNAQKLVGLIKKGPIKKESISRKNARRSIIANCDIKVGEIITASHLTLKRPGFGIHPRYIQSIVGRKAAVNIQSDDILEWKFFD